jgi:hypothetical protein
MSVTISIWTIYDHPKDFPNFFVARRWEVEGGSPLATTEIITSTSLERVRNEMETLGLTKLMSTPKDQPHIVEVWL